MPRLSKIGAACLSAFGFGTGGAAVVTADYLVVAGGGGGGCQLAGGAGAGGYQTGTTTLNLTQSYTVIVGAGGAAATTVSANGVNGSNSSFGALTASVGGGGGGTDQLPSGSSGGSGGGAGRGGSTGGSGTSGQGYAGGDGLGGNCGGGGGGAGAIGANSASGNGGNGGTGVASSITGTSTYYAGGGGGGAFGTGTVGTGGNGGGGSGSNTSIGGRGTANLGGGGGGGGYVSGTPQAGGQGGSGVVVIRYSGAQKFGGGIVSSDGTYTIHTFKTSGQLVPMTPVTASYLIVAGGAGGGARGNRGGGGGGAGGLLTGSTLSIDTSSTYVVTVGSGGAGTAGEGVNGTSSSLSIVSTTAVGGGKGGADAAGATGGSGGGGDGTGHAGGSGTSGQGNNGGAGTSGGPYTYFAGGGGGGAGAAGANGAPNSAGGAGGAGVSSSITGTATYYAGGGGGGAGAYDGSNGPSSANGGNGGGGAGTGTLGATAGAGTANTGGGGGGANSGSGGNGGSGVVVIAYAGTTQLMAGGTVTIVGGNVIHTFTSSGYLTPLTFVGRSLRFRNSAATYLSKTFSATSNRKTFTWSGWVKLGKAGINSSFFEARSGTNLQTTFSFGSDDKIFVQHYNTSSGINIVWQTAAVFRDPAAWYHLTFTVDTTQASSANGVKLYVNGVQQSLTFTSYGGSYSQNMDLYVNLNTATHYIGIREANSSQVFDGYMAEVRFIDGQALTPNSFGTFNSYGVWQPINYGGSYGTNGFYLPFNQNTTSTYAGQFSGSNNLTVGTTATNFLCTSSNSGITATFEAWVNPTAYNTQGSAWMYSPVYAKGGTYFNFGVRNGQVRFYWYDGGFNSVDSPSTNDVPLNTWTHIAATLSGNTIKIYINGVLKTTSTSFTGISSGGLNTDELIGKETGGNTFFSGSISNLRVSNTVLYAGDFVPSTSPLTSASSTKVLTLQNSSIVDNSSNAYTITNVGSVTTAAVTPFTNATTLVKDEGPQGNNWIPANISTTVGSTYDSMTDVPTLTSATAANYCVLNPLAKHPTAAYTTLSNANLTATYASADGIAYGTIGVTTGKFYWEHTIGTAGSIQIVGVSTCPDATYQRVIRTDTGQYLEYNGGSATWTTYGASSTTGDIIGVALDMTAQTIEFFKNGTSQGQKTSIGLTGLTIMPFVVLGSSAVCSYNFGQRPFAYTPPSGFVALNTYNL